MPHAPRRAAFTLLELLIVVGVIALLIGLALAVGHHVSGAGREEKTRYTLKALDQVLEEYIAQAGGIPGPTVEDPRTTAPPGQRYLQVVADAHTNEGGGGGRIINSVGLFEVQCRAQPSAAAAFQGLDTRFLRELDVDSNGSNWGDPFPPLRTTFDAWDRPIRYVHPKLHGLIYDPSGDPPGPKPVSVLLGPAPSGSQYLVNAIRRFRDTTSDADGGMCRGGRPYFYSAGADGDPATLEDNVYLLRPEFQKN